LARLFHGFPKFCPAFLTIVKVVLLLGRRRPRRRRALFGLFFLLVLEFDRRLSDRRVGPERFQRRLVL
jgi:hypothetical protein